MRILLVLFCSFTIAACGGGGGGNSEETSSPGSINIDSTNAELIITLGIGFAESLQQLISSGANSVSSATKINSNEINQNCLSPRNGFFPGTRQILLEDTDSNNGLSSGDILTIQLDNCRDGELNGTATGAIKIVIDQAFSITDSIGRNASTALIEGTISFPGTLTIDGNPDDILVDGEFHFSYSYSNTPNTETIMASSKTGQTLSIELAGQTETLRDFSLSRTLNNNNYSIEFVGTVESGTLGGELSCTGKDIGGEAITTSKREPLSGEMICQSTNRSAARLTSNNGLASTLAVDTNGSSTFTNLGDRSWLQFIEGNLFAEKSINQFGNIAASFPTVNPIASINIPVTDAVFSPATSYLYIANDMGITILRPNTLEIIDTINLSGIPNVLAVSDDGVTIYIAYKDINEIQTLNVTNLSLGSSFSLGNDLSAIPFFARDIQPSPGQPGTIAVSITTDISARSSITYAAIFDNGIRRSDILIPAFRGSVNKLVITDNGQLYGHNPNNSGAELREIFIDENGATEGRTLTKHIFAGSKDLINIGNKLLSSAGSLIDFRENRSLGFLKQNRGETTAIPFYDTDTGKIYTFTGDITGNKLITYNATNLAPLGIYKVPVDTGIGAMKVLKVLGANNSLILVTELKLAIIDKLDITDYILKECETIDLSVFNNETQAKRVNCIFNDVVYDPTRNKLYASIPSDIGKNGNSIAVINPETAIIEEFIPIGSEPTKLAISTDKNSLYITLSTSNNNIVELNLNTKQASFIGPFTDSAGFPAHPENITASPFESQDILVSLDSGDLRLVSSGIEAPNTISSYDPEIVAFSQKSPDIAYGLRLNRFRIFNIDSSGISLTQYIDNLIRGPSVFAKDHIYTVGGKRFNLETLVVEEAFNLPSGSRLLAVDTLQNLVVFLSSDHSLSVFDDATGNKIKDYLLPDINRLLNPNVILTTLPNELVIFDSSRILIIPKTEVYQ